METTTKQQDGNSADRVVEALDTLVASLCRTINEVKSLDSDFRSRLVQAVHDAEAFAQSQAAQHLQKALAETRSDLEEQFKNKIAELSAEWEKERLRLNAAVDRAAEAGAVWEAERGRLNDEIERLTLALAKAQTDSDKAHEAAQNAAASAAQASTPVYSAVFLQEVERAENLVKQISVLIDESATDLSLVIRKNVERAELEAYLKGIRFTIAALNSK